MINNFTTSKLLRHYNSTGLRVFELSANSCLEVTSSKMSQPTRGMRNNQAVDSTSMNQTSNQATNQSTQSNQKHKRFNTNRKKKPAPAPGGLKCSPEDFDWVNDVNQHVRFDEAIKSGDCTTIAKHMRAHLSVAQARSPADALSHVQELANMYCNDCPSPPTLTLELIQLPDMYRRSKVDLSFVVLRELFSYRHAINSQIDDLSQDIASSPAHAAEAAEDLAYFHSRIDISDNVRAQARQLLDMPYITSKAFAQLVKTYEVPLDFNEMMRYVEAFRTCRDGAQTPDTRRESVELAIRLGANLHSQMNHSDFLSPVLYDKANINVIYQYIDSLTAQPAVKESVLIWCIDAFAEIHLASSFSLLKRYNRALTLHPWVRMRKAFEEIWFTVRFNLVDEFAEVLCGNDKQLQIKCLKQLAKCRNPSDLNSIRDLVVKWRLEHYPEAQALVELAEATEAATCRMSSARADDTAEVFTMPDSMIHIVDNDESLALAERFLLDPAVTMIGLDAEYVSVNYVTLGIVTKHCQWLQCATHTHTFLIDLQPLTSRSDYSDQLSNMIRQMLTSKASKYGMGFDGDLKMLKADFPNSIAFHGGTSHYYELLPLLSRSNEPDDGFDAVSNPEVVHMCDGPFKKKEGGLAKLTRMFTGKKLDKTCQISLWSRRPLRPQQIKYAACDAYVQLLIVDALDARQRAQLSEKFLH